MVQAALGEASPVSKVGDHLDAPSEPAPNPPIVALSKRSFVRPTRLRFGWPRLKTYFDETVIGITEKWWRQVGDIRVNGETKTILFVDGVRGHNWRVPQASLAGGMNWCGIFATWCWRQAGVQVKWNAGSLTKPDKRAFVVGSSPKPGDILVLNNGQVHHGVLLPDDIDAKEFRVVAGNATYQKVAIETFPRNLVVAYYSLDDRRRDAGISS